MDFYGRSPLIHLWIMAPPFSRIEFVQALLSISSTTAMEENRWSTDPLYWAAANGTCKECELMIKAGACLSNVRACLTRAIAWCNLSTYDLLVSYLPSAWVTEPDDNGRMALHAALRRPYFIPNRTEMIKRVLAAGANVHLHDRDGRTAEDIAKNTDRDYASWMSEDPSSDELPPRCFETYVEALRASGYDVSVDDEGDIVWTATEHMPAFDQQDRVTELV